MNRSFRFWFKYILTLVIMLGSIGLLAFADVKAPFDIILYLLAAGCPFMLWHYVGDWKTEQYVADKAAGKFDDIVPDAPIVISKQEERRNGFILINVAAVLVITFAVSFLVDGYVCHDIPASLNTGSEQVLRESGTEYAEATILNGRSNDHHGQKVLLVELDGNRHLLYFVQHSFTDRWKLHDSKAIEPDFNGAVSIGRGTLKKHYNLSDTGLSPMGQEVYLRNYEIVLYLAIAVAVTAVETLLFCKVIYPKKK